MVVGKVKSVTLVAASGRWRGRTADGWWRLQHRYARLQRLHWDLIGRFGKLHGPGWLIAGIDLKEARAVIAARKAVLGPADGKLLFPRAHEGLARPFAAAVVIDCIDVIESR